MSGLGEVIWMMKVDGWRLLHYRCFLVLGNGQRKAFLTEGIRIHHE